MSSESAMYETNGMRSGAVPLDEAGARAKELAAKLAAVLEPWTGSGATPATKAFGMQIKEPGDQMIAGLGQIGELFQQRYAAGVRRAAERVDNTIEANTSSVPEM